MWCSHADDDAVLVLRVLVCFFFQAEDGIRDLVRSRGLGDVYKRQLEEFRLLALRRVKEGEKPSAVVKSLGMNRTSIYRLSLIHI